MEKCDKNWEKRKWDLQVLRYCEPVTAQSQQ